MITVAEAFILSTCLVRGISAAANYSGLRGGVAKLNESHRLAPLWQALLEELRLSPDIYLATNSPAGLVVDPRAGVSGAPGVDEMPLCSAAAVVGTDRCGPAWRTLTFRRGRMNLRGDFTGVTDGARGRQVPSEC